MLCVGIVPGRRQPCKVSTLDAFICPFCCVPWPEKTSQVPFSWQEVTAAPAVCDGKLQGILTFADGCVLRADVGIYTRIINYMPWIENTIRNNWALTAGILDHVIPSVPESSLRIKYNPSPGLHSRILDPVTSPVPKSSLRIKSNQSPELHLSHSCPTEWVTGTYLYWDYKHGSPSSFTIDDDGKFHTP